MLSADKDGGVVALDVGHGDWSVECIIMGPGSSSHHRSSLPVLSILPHAR